MPYPNPHTETMLAINDRLTTAMQGLDKPADKILDTDNAEIIKEEDSLSASFEIGDDDDDDEAEEREKDLKELRSEIEAEESAAFLKAKKSELIFEE